MGQLRRRFWLEAGCAVASAVLAVVTMFWRDWIEVTGWDPDRGDGSLEWVFVAGLALVSALSALAARLELRQRTIRAPRAG